MRIAYIFSMRSELKYPILILGIGNLLMLDDGVGVYLAQKLQNQTWPLGVTVLEAGTALFNYLEEISQAQTVLLIDAVRAGGIPGNIYRLNLTDLVSSSDGCRDAHGFSLYHLIQLARKLTGYPKQVLIYGVEPKELGPGLGLSSEVGEILPKVLQAIAREIEKILNKY